MEIALRRAMGNAELEAIIAPDSGGKKKNKKRRRREKSRSQQEDIMSRTLEMQSSNE